MSDHHWYDDDSHHEDSHHEPLPDEEVLPAEELSAPEPGWEQAHQQSWEHPADPVQVEQPHHHPEPPETPDGGPAAEVIGADPDAVPESPGGEDVFPPQVHVGELPEPVDGFPWIDTGSLGVVPAAEVPAGPGAVEPAELAGYAAADLPPGQDPWETLQNSDDPATAALAKFYSPGRTSPDS